MTGFGSNGPKSSLPGFGKIAEGMSGMLPLVRTPVENSVFVGFSLADASTAMFGLFGIALALYERDIFDARGAHVDLALYEPLFRMLDCRLAVRAAKPSITGSGNDDHPYGWGSGESMESSMHVVRCASGEWLAVYVPERSALDRVAGGAPAAGSVKERLSALAAARSAHDVASLLGPAGIQMTPVFDGLSIFNERYFQERGDVLTVETEIGTLGVPGPYPKDPAHIATMTRFRPAPLGADNAAVFPPGRDETS
jgi:crotonobetainyl-CoA:carnitine CoA-transferase CaiB-like acyl-CoA transferase